MSQEQGRDRAVAGPDPAPPAWSAPDAPPDSGRAWSPPGDPRAQSVPPPAATTAAPPAPAPPVYRPRPGGIPLRPLGVGDVLDGTFTTIRHNPRATLGLAALLVTVQQGLVVTVQLLTGGIPTLTGLTDDSFSLQVLGGFDTIVGTLLSALVGAVLTGMLVVVVSEDVLGRQVTAGQVWGRIRPRIGALLVASAIAGLLPYLGLVLLVAPGVILWGAWALTTPALILEGLGPVKALRRSWQLAWPDFGRVWSIRTLSVLLATLMQYLVAVPFAAVAVLTAYALGANDGDQEPLIALVLVVRGGIAAGTLTAPFLAGVLALLYVDRRMRAEGLDLILRRQARAARSAASRLPGAPGTTAPAPAGGGP